MDAWGHATIVTEANGVTLTRGYDPATGLGISVVAAGKTGGNLAELTMQWDGFGNLASRDDSLNGSTETATYDDLNRLHTTNLSYSLAGGGTLARSFAYDATGNRTRACAGGDCTAYGYGAGHGLLPHAVTSVNGDSTDYAYDANGEMTSDADRSLSWTAFGKAETITQGSYRVSLAYGPDHARTRKTLTSGHVTAETVTYLGAAEVLSVSGHTSIRRTLALADVAVIDTGGYGAKLLYPVTDHLGSVMAMSDGAGALAAQPMAYGPFGQRRTAGWAQAMPPTTALNINENDTDKGYTGQEGLDAVGLWDYNARLYDPALGRFLSVDPLIAHPGSTQSINPYSYVENNPLNKTDPTGMADTTCTGTGSNRTCTTTTTPTGTHIPQTTTTHFNSAGKATSTTGAGALPGGRIATSVDGNSSMSLSVSGSAVGAKSSSAKNNANTHDINNHLPQSNVVYKGDGVPKGGWKASDSSNPHAQEKAIDAPARAGLSIAEKLTEKSGHEYAGAVVQSPDGRLYYTNPVRGKEGNFAMSVGLPNGWHMVAIFHTHPAAMNDQHGFSKPDILEIGALRKNPAARNAITYVGAPDRDVIVYNPAFDHPLGQFRARALGLQAGGAAGRTVCSQCLP